MVLCLVFLPFVWWAAAITACAIAPDKNFIQILETLSEKLEQPFFITYTPYTFKCILIFTAAYFLGIGIYESQKRNYRRGVEHGSAKWGNVSEICRRYCEKRYTQNLLLTQHFRMGLDGYKHKRNLNVLVVGGSGAGKSRTYAIPNIMQCNCSMVITDPKAELLRKTGGVLERNGYEVRVFDLINPETSWCYNPFAYVWDDKDVLKLINNLIRNTTPKGAQSSDPFWEKSETALLQALMLYLLHEAPPEEQNFPMIMEMLGSAQVKEDDEDYQSPLDILFERLEMRDPESIAVKQYAIYKQAAGLALSSELFINGSLNTFAQPTNVNKKNRIMDYDIRELGEQLMPLGMLVTLDSIFNRVIQNWKEGKTTWIFADEFYLLFRYEYSANFFYRLYKRIRKYNGFVTGLTQNVEELLKSDTARLMLANSEFLILLNQASTDREELAALLNISENQLSYITNVSVGSGLIRCSGNIVPFENTFPKNTDLYKLMTTKPGES